MREIRIIIISGLSGSGKSTALRTLEDLGFFCVDNLPILLLPKFIELCQNSSNDISKIALVMDVREQGFLKEYPHILDMLKTEGYYLELLFLDSSDDVLIQRFSETRRQHPLSEEGSVLEGIQIEREMLGELKSRADKILDTSNLNVHQLRTHLKEYFQQISVRSMHITFLSFGFKYGVPHDADLVLDVRFLPNPYFVVELKDLDGTDKRVAEYVFRCQETQTYLEKLRDFIAFQIPLFEREGKTYLTIAIGCTGGRHRSVVIADYLKETFAKGKYQVYSTHRDLKKNSSFE
ncbi:MAG: RNase adapter RapZ [Proteobacteria bacterium]|nr:RNase adapter RapZ [Pseudomonadota bacterium]